MRAFNSKIDKYYSPDDTPEIFLKSEQVEEALSTINLIDNSDEEIEVRSVIRKIEELNRKEKKGEISEMECNNFTRKITNNFAEKYDFWPYMTKTYKAFYKYFIR